MFSSFHPCKASKSDLRKEPPLSMARVRFLPAGASFHYVSWPEATHELEARAMETSIQARDAELKA